MSHRRAEPGKGPRRIPPPRRDHAPRGRCQFRIQPAVHEIVHCQRTDATTSAAPVSPADEANMLGRIDRSLMADRREDTISFTPPRLDPRLANLAASTGVDHHLEFQAEIAGWIRVVRLPTVRSG